MQHQVILADDKDDSLDELLLGVDQFMTCK